MHFALPKIYPITDVRLSGISHVEQVKRLIDGGAEFIQLREKYLAPKDFYADAERALKIARDAKVKIIINDRVDIALALQADGVHLGQDDLPPDKAREILGENAIIGFSTHNIQQAIEAIKFPVDYIAVGPVFATKTKENPDEIVGLEGVKIVREAIGDFPLVAIGGINFENFESVLKSGADSVAIVSGIVSEAEKIAENFSKFLT
ncbi:MAG: thiamine phosphate synthase [Pyrinomonadaceae bacterium]